MEHGKTEHEKDKHAHAGEGSMENERAKPAEGARYAHQAEGDDQGENKRSRRGGHETSKGNTNTHKHEEKKPNKMPVVVLFLLLFTAFYVYTLVIKPKTIVNADDGNNYIKYKGEVIPLRATVGECKSVPVSPGTKKIASTLANTKRIVMLVNPYEEDKYYRVNIGQIALIARSKYLNKPLTYAYTQEYENGTEPIAPDVVSPDFGNANHATVMMEPGNETAVRMEKEGQIRISAKEGKDYDKAVCALELSVLGVT